LPISVFQFAASEQQNQELLQQSFLELGCSEPGDHCDPKNWPKH